MKILPLFIFRKMPRIVTVKHTVGFENARIAPVFCRYHSTETAGDEFEYDVKHVKIPSSTSGQDRSKVEPLLLEIDLLRQMDVNSAPDTLDPTQWKILSNIKRRSDRLKFYKSLVVENKTRRSSDICSVSEPVCVEESSADSLFLPVTDSRINRFLNYKLLLAELFGPTLIIDCNYENQIKPHLLNSLINDLLNVWFLNREAENPFRIIYCNVDKYGELFRRLREKFYGDEELDCMLNTSEDDYTELFPPAELMYLTPSSKCDMGKFDGRDVLIMGEKTYFLTCTYKSDDFFKFDVRCSRRFCR